MMKKISRREFIGKSSIGIGSAVIASQIPMDLSAFNFLKPVKMPLGFQIWTMKDRIVNDFAGTLKEIAGLGYQTVEMCSPPGYDLAPLMKLKAREMKNIINDAGLAFESMHYQFGELRTHLDERIEFASESGLKQMVLTSFGLPKNATLDDWRKAADELNNIGAKTKKAGIQTGFHNHSMEFEKIGETLIYDSLMKQFNPGYVKMQFQVGVISIGYKASDYFKKYPGRFISAHLADWSPKEKKSLAIGEGIVDWKDFFASLETGGVKNLFLEIGGMNNEILRNSATYIRNL